MPAVVSGDIFKKEEMADRNDLAYLMTKQTVWTI
jgi:hypothetical protein